MTRMKFALGSAAIAATLAVGIAPVSAYTRHPATPDETRQTDDLNAQSLAAARAGEEPSHLTTDRRTADTPHETGDDAKPAEAMPGANMPDAIHPTPENPPDNAVAPDVPNANAPDTTH